MKWNGCKVFSATMPTERSNLGEKVTAWIAERGVRAVDVVVSQSSDQAFHCLSITLFYVGPR